MRFKSVVFVVFALLVNFCYAAKEPVNNRIQGTNLFSLVGSSSTLDISDNKYYLVQANAWQNIFTIQHVENKITLGIDESDMTYENSVYAYRITFDISYQELISNSLVTQSISNVQLDVNFDPSRGTTYKDRSVFSFVGGLDVQISITALEADFGSGWTNVTSNPPSQLFLESEIITERFYEFDQYLEPSDNIQLSQSNGMLEVNWPYIEGAEQYELEWAWINAYTGEINAQLEPEIETDLTLVAYNFEQNASAVVLTGQNFYSIPMIYGNGYVVVRYRGIGRGGANFKSSLDGAWNSKTEGAQGFLSNYSNHIEVDAHENHSINYGAGMSFIENGVRSTGVTYMDGVLKPRQSQAQLNSQDQIIVGSTIYDYHGRPAIGVMSAPVQQTYLGYVDDLNMFDAGIPYDKSHFDLDSDPLACGLLNSANPMSAQYSSGAANFYSEYNSNKEGPNAYLPDAEEFPFVQVQYDNDPTGRIKRVGGIGPDHQFGTTTGSNSGHYTEYFYTVPDNLELFRLFGNDAATYDNYTKVITKDVHGQISVALIDGMGRTVATYLEGPSPDGLETIEGNSAPTPSGIDLALFNQIDPSSGVLEVQTPIVITDVSQDYIFSYDFSTVSFTDCLPANICFDCVYDLVIQVITEDPDVMSVIKDENDALIVDDDNNDGNLDDGIFDDNVVTFRHTVGSVTNFDINCDDPIQFSNEGAGFEDFTLNFCKIGDYQIIKKLVVSQAPIDYYFDQYVENNEDCLLDYNYFLDNSLANIDVSNCDQFEPCELEFLDLYGTFTEQTSDPVLTQQEYDDAKDAFYLECKGGTSCDIMLPFLLEDMSPGGQYGSTDNPIDPISIYVENNSAFNGDDWRDIIYLNVDGTPSLINGQSAHTVSLAEFEANFQPQWAEQLIQFHPEFCYYDFCSLFPELFEFGNEMLTITNFGDACTDGYLEPSTGLSMPTTNCSATQQIDPIFAYISNEWPSYPTGVPQEIIDAVDDLNADFSGGYSIYEVAVLQAGDVGTVIFGDPNSCHQDAHWFSFRALYLAKRNYIIDLLKEDYIGSNASCRPGECVGLGSSTTVTHCINSPFLNSIPRYVSWASLSGYDLSQSGTLDWSAVQTMNQAAIDQNCSDVCNNMADNWMAQLSGCVTYLPVGEVWAAGTGAAHTTYNNVRDELIEVCINGCSQEWPFMAQNYPAGTATGPEYNSFSSVIIDLLGPEIAECSSLLINSPSSNDGLHSIATTLDKCACDKLLPTTDLNDFIANNGFSVSNYDTDKCNCETYDLDNNNVLSASEETAVVSAQIFITDEYYCYQECITCADISNLTSSFNTDYGIFYYENPTLFTNYVNDIHQSDYSYLQLVTLDQNCAALSVSGNHVFGGYTNEAAEIISLLEKLNQNELYPASANTYSDLQLPEYFYSSLNLDGVTSLNYQATITGSDLSFNLPDAAGVYNCSVDLELQGPVPSGFTAQEMYEGIVSFGQPYLLAGSISISATNEFYVTAVLNDPSSIEIELKITTCYDVLDVIDDNGISLDICPFDQVLISGDPCMQSLIAGAEISASEEYGLYLIEQKELFAQSYIERCTQVNETFDFNYEANRYHFTLLYYDQSGNLVQTVPPRGVSPLSDIDAQSAYDYGFSLSGSPVYPNNHTYQTKYSHNTLNQVTEVQTPDGGLSKYFYDHIGRLVVSQDAQQLTFQDGIITDNFETGNSIPAYSYTIYDEIGRVIEVGELITPATITQTIAEDPISLNAWLEAGPGKIKNNVTFITYDDAYSIDAENMFGIEGYGDVRNRISASSIVEGYVYPTGSQWIYPNPDYINHYQYDVHGNVSKFLQEIPALDQHNNRFREIEYDYDLISGNPNFIYFQRGKVDQFIHKYIYDADNRLSEVFTSSDGLIWDRDVDYEYRADGYLARTELGEMKVQGCDYAYTIHGWLKSLNSGVLDANRDMGKDGNDVSATIQYSSAENEIHQLVARDALSYTIGYYNNDYNAISRNDAGFGIMEIDNGLGNFNSDIEELFNGNITSLTTNQIKTDGNQMDIHANTYHYDQLHRFKEMHVFTDANISTTNNLQNASRQNIGVNGLGDYEVEVNYDPNGNITSLIRNSFTSNSGVIHDNGMDDFDYQYTAYTNKLDHVVDLESGTGSLGFGDIQDLQAPGNYEYHENGRLRSDVMEQIEHIDWYPNGKIKRIYRTAFTLAPDLYFEYDAMGMRTLKVEMTKASAGVLNTSDQWVYTYYACDANGITMAIYNLDLTREPAELERIESMIYGGSRIGMETTAIVVSDLPNYATDCNTDGLASGVIQLSNPLPSGSPDIIVYLDGVAVSDPIPFTGNYFDVASALGTSLESYIPDVEATPIVNSNFIGLTFLEIKELVPGALVGNLTFTIGGTSAPSAAFEIIRQPSIGDCHPIERQLGKKFYELTNHLGNVMEVISDRKIQHEDQNNLGFVDYFEADVVSYSDYYPFGMIMPGRNGMISGADYRYAFNGMESDKEVSGQGNSYTTQFRQYDPRLGRWKSLDPLAALFPWQSPFVGMDNNPIVLTDIFGLATNQSGDPKKGDTGGRQGNPNVNEGKSGDKGLYGRDADGRRYVNLDFSMEDLDNAWSVANVWNGGDEGWTVSLEELYTANPGLEANKNSLGDGQTIYLDPPKLEEGDPNSDPKIMTVAQNENLIDDITTVSDNQNEYIQGPVGDTEYFYEEPHWLKKFLDDLDDGGEYYEPGGGETDDGYGGGDLPEKDVYNFGGGTGYTEKELDELDLLHVDRVVWGPDTSVKKYYIYDEDGKEIGSFAHVNMLTIKYKYDFYLIRGQYTVFFDENGDTIEVRTPDSTFKTFPR